MTAPGILTSVSVLLLAAAIWDDLRKNDRVTPARKTYLLTACLLAAMSTVVQLVF